MKFNRVAVAMTRALFCASNVVRGYSEPTTVRTGEEADRAVPASVTEVRYDVVTRSPIVAHRHLNDSRHRERFPWNYRERKRDYINYRNKHVHSGILWTLASMLLNTEVKYKKIAFTLSHALKIRFGLSVHIILFTQSRGLYVFWCW